MLAAEMLTSAINKKIDQKLQLLRSCLEKRERKSDFESEVRYIFDQKLIHANEQNWLNTKKDVK